jgi:hypothetical protein
MNNIAQPQQTQRSGSTTDMASTLLTNFAASTGRCMDWNAEVAWLMTTRMRRDAETVQAAMGCDNGLKLTEIRQAWMSQAVEDYVHETQHLMEMSSDIVAWLFTSARQAAPPATTEGVDTGRTLHLTTSHSASVSVVAVRRTLRSGTVPTGTVERRGQARPEVNGCATSSGAEAEAV